MPYQPKHTHREEYGERISCGCPKVQMSETEWRVIHVVGCSDVERDEVRQAMSRKTFDAEVIEEDANLGE